MFEFLKDRFERNLFYGALVALSCLLMVKIKFAPPNYILKTWPELITILQSKAFEDIVGDLLTGIISAYLFYLAIEVLPRLRKERNTMEILNRLVASIIDSYSNTQFFGHTMAINQTNTSLLSVENINKIIEEVRENPSFSKLKCALFTAHSRYSDFSATLNIASTINADRALHWLILTDKVRLLVENYGEDPESSGYEPRHVYGGDRREVDQDANEFLRYESALEDYLGSLQIGVLEYLEQARNWVSPLPMNDPANTPHKVDKLEDDVSIPPASA